jgi:hypothetical protein
MKPARLAIVVAFLSAAGTFAAAQEKQSGDTQPKTQVARTRVQTEGNLVPLKVTVVFNEFDGEKKLSSLPYVLFLMNSPPRFVGVVRMGVRVPIWTGSKDSAITYQDVGTNLDCVAQLTEDGRYALELTVDRSSAYPASTSTDERSSEPQRFSEHPLLRTFRANFSIMLRDGQTTQSIVATDPLNGHVIKVDVTLNVLK